MCSRVCRWGRTPDFYADGELLCIAICCGSAILGQKPSDQKRLARQLAWVDLHSLQGLRGPVTIASDDPRGMTGLQIQDNSECRQGCRKNLEHDQMAIFRSKRSWTRPAMTAASLATGRPSDLERARFSAALARGPSPALRATPPTNWAR